jgi:phospholipase C
LAGHRWNVTAGQFDTDVAAGQLPDVAWLYPPSGLSEHPPDHRNAKPVLPPGVAWTVARIGALTASPLWAKTAVFITWDDWGGWYDHVVPPLQSKWTGGGPAGYTGSQFRYGNRVPCLVLSPYSKPGLNHDFFSHVSVVKFCLRLFPNVVPWAAPALATDDLSGDMWTCFTFGTVTGP